MKRKVYVVPETQMKGSTVSELQVHSMSDESPVPEVQVLDNVVVP